ncbi:helix-turn-helix DNA binding domain protein [Gordonia phage Upyo]|nr:helix-turn-helix DNA binding domain protein [Gordonia phage Upyo]
MSGRTPGATMAAVADRRQDTAILYRRGCSREEMARRLGVDIRTVYRDIALLRREGVIR